MRRHADCEFFLSQIPGRRFFLSQIPPSSKSAWNIKTARVSHKVLGTFKCHWISFPATVQGAGVTVQTTPAFRTRSHFRKISDEIWNAEEKRSLALFMASVRKRNLFEGHRTL
jgi:hypothetical protein